MFTNYDAAGALKCPCSVKASNVKLWPRFYPRYHNSAQLSCDLFIRDLFIGGNSRTIQLLFRAGTFVKALVPNSLSQPLPRSTVKKRSKNEEPFLLENETRKRHTGYRVCG